MGHNKVDRKSIVDSIQTIEIIKAVHEVNIKSLSWDLIPIGYFKDLICTKEGKNILTQAIK